MSEAKSEDERTLLEADVCPQGKCVHRTQQEKRRAHGTPDEFEAAVWRAQADGYVTGEEAFEASQSYRRDYYEAPDGP